LKFFELSFLVYYIATTIRESRQLENILLLFSVGAFFSSLLAIAQFITQGSIGGPLYFLGERFFTSQTPGIANASLNGALVLRPYATFSHPNVLAGFLLCVLILLLLVLPLMEKRLTRIMFVITLLVGTSALLLTMSRVAIVIWSLIIIFFMIVQAKKKTIVFLLLLGCSFLFFVFSFFFSPIGTRILQTRLTEESVVQREALIHAAFLLFNKHPYLGVGLGNFLPSLTQMPQLVTSTQYLQPVHNIFLLIITETGIVGGLFFLWFLGKTYQQLLFMFKKKSQLSIPFSITLSTILILGLFDHYFLTLQQGQLLLAVILGLCWTGFIPRRQ
jgi:O-antigen ligase